MRRSLIGLLIVVAAGLLLVTGCEFFMQSATLRVVSINDGKTLRADIADYWVYMTPDSELVSIYQYMPESVKVVLQYVEIGAGLPTWTPYEALIEEAKISYRSTNTENPPDSAYSKAVIPLAQTVTADKTGKTTHTFYLTAMSATFKQAFFEAAEPPPEGDDYSIVDVIDATIEFKGYDSVAGRAVKAKGEFQIEVGNFYDDLNRLGN